MKTYRLVIIILFLLSIPFLPQVFSQNYSQWGLPDGAKRRIGKGFITENMVFSPDSIRIAVASYIGIWIYNVQTGEELNLLTNNTGFVNSIAYSPDNKTLVGSTASEFYVWDEDSGEVKYTISAHTYDISDLAMNPDGNLIATCGDRRDHTIKVWDSLTGVLITTLQGHSDDIYNITFSPDGKILASAGKDDDINTIKLWDINTGELRTTFNSGIQYRDMTVVFSPDGNTIASCYGKWGDERIQLWDVSSNTVRETLIGHIGGVRSIAFSPDGNTLVSGGVDRTICLWDVINGTYLTTLIEHTDDVVNVVFSPDGNTLATGSMDGSVVLWDTQNYQKISKITGHNDRINEFAFSPDGKTIVSGNRDRTVRLWDTETGRNLNTFIGHNSSVFSVAISPDGKTIASGGEYGSTINGWYSDDFSIKLWDVDSGIIKNTLIGHYSAIYNLSFSMDGTILTSTAGWDSTLWDMNTGNPIWTLSGDRDNPMGSITFSPDGNTFITAGKLGIQFWDLNTMQPIPLYTGLPDGYAFGIYSPDGRTLAVSGMNSDIHLLDISRGTFQTIQTPHTGRITIPAFSMDGKILATASSSNDNTIRFWDLESNELKYTITSNPDKIYQLKFSPDGNTIATTGIGGVIYLWNYPFAIEQPTQIADINSDGVVDISDLVLVAANFGKTGENVADVNGDGIVNITDLIAVAASINNTNAAPSLNADTIQRWITDAQQLRKNDPTIQKGISILNQLLITFIPKMTTA
ncbi:PD40 domain-containing protein [Candidatus Poribacteria bacterium]|nr:PD40 domain-containing protein [Candidatus Poribacteria bacterium]